MIKILNFGEVTPEQVFAQSDRLVEMGLDIPDVTRVFMGLRKLGLDVPLVYSVEKAVEVLTAMKGRA